LYLGNDLDFIAALRRALAEAAYQLVSCAHREHAIMFLKSEIRYDLLLIDLEWQGTEGLELARHTHSLRHRKRMPIVLVAASGLNSHLKTLAGRAGVKMCVTKTPVEAVIGAIRQMTGG
jgi:CheY-like chemotaxis protein